MRDTADRMAAEAMATPFALGSEASKANSAVLTPYLSQKKEKKKRRKKSQVTKKKDKKQKKGTTEAAGTIGEGTTKDRSGFV